MSDKNLHQLPLATTASGALIYGVQDNQDKAFPAAVLQGSEQPQAANLVYAGPPAAPGNYPTFRPLVIQDIPDLSTIYLKSNGGTLVSPTINNATIVGGTISGVDITADDDKWRVRNSLDTTKVIRFNVSTISAGQTRVFSWPDLDGTVVTTNAAQTLSNKIAHLVAGSSASASFRIPHGQPPASPINGDMWTTNAGLYVQVNNATVGPLAATASSTVTTFNGRQGAVTLTFADIVNALGFTPYNPSTDNYVKKSGDTMSGPLDMKGNVSRVRLYDDNQDITVLDIVAGVNNSTDRNGVVINRNTTGQISLYARNGDVRLDVGSTVNGSRFSGPLTVGGDLKSTEQVWGAGRSLVQEGYTGAPYPAGKAAGLAMPTGSASANLFSYNYQTSTYIPMEYLALNHTFSGRVNATTDVRVSSSSASYIFADRGGGSDWSLYANGGSARLNHSANGDRLTINAAGDTNVTGILTAGGGFGPGSDPRLKDESTLKAIDNPLDILYNLNVRKGQYLPFYNPDGKDRLFLMADDAMKAYAPELLLEDVIEVGDDKYNGWSADQTIALLVASVQQLSYEVEALKEKLNERY